jgi:hypothetical protein
LSNNKIPTSHSLTDGNFQTIGTQLQDDAHEAACAIRHCKFRENKKNTKLEKIKAYLKGSLKEPLNPNNRAELRLSLWIKPPPGSNYYTAAKGQL